MLIRCIPTVHFTRWANTDHSVIGPIGCIEVGSSLPLIGAPTLQGSLRESLSFDGLVEEQIGLCDHHLLVKHPNLSELGRLIYNR